MPPFAEPHKTRLRLLAWSGILFLLLFLSAEVLLRSRAQRPVTAAAENEMSVQYPVMGTVASVKLYGQSAESREAAAKEIAATFSRIEKLGSLYDENSEISRLNASAYDAPFACSEDLWQILTAARQAYTLSDGAFDISAKPLMNLWGFYRKNKPNQLPSDAERKAALDKVGLDKIIFDDKNHTVRFTVPRMALDLGGIAKGYAVDLAIQKIDRKAISGGIINLGGNLRVFGTCKGKGVYRIGVKDPVSPAGLDAVLCLQDESTATSGNYERFVVIGGKRFCHIVDPKIGLPVSNMHAVTVVTQKALDADIFSTSVFLRGEAMARKIASAVPKTSFLLYNGNGQRLTVAIPSEKIQFISKTNSKTE